MTLTREQLLLICLAEECNEVAQRASKALRFGLHEVQPGQPYDNSQRLTDELIDLLGVMELLEQEKMIVMPQNLETLIAKKGEKFEKYRKFSAGESGHPEGSGYPQLPAKDSP